MEETGSAAHNEADENPEREDVTDARVGCPVVLFLLHERGLGEDANVGRQPFLKRCLHGGKVGAVFQPDQADFDEILRMRGVGASGWVCFSVAEEQTAGCVVSLATIWLMSSSSAPRSRNLLLWCRMSLALSISCMCFGSGDW